jgi:hypothetical protein
MPWGANDGDLTMALPAMFMATLCLGAAMACVIIRAALIALRPATRRGLAPRLR